MAEQDMIFHLCVRIASSRSAYRARSAEAVAVWVTDKAYLTDLVLGHSPRNVAFVLENEQACSHQTLYMH